jgi:hypothetical protein
MARRRNVRHEIMIQLYGYRGATARSADRIARLCRREGELTDLTATEVEQECAYLLGKNLVSEERDPVAKEERRWKITSEGIDFCEENLI